MSSAHWLGLDIGATKLLALALDERGAVLACETAPTRRERGPDDVLSRAADLAQQVSARAGGLPAGAGVGVAGLVDHATGRVLSSIMLPGWDDWPLAERLAARLGIPCLADNDATAAGWGEFVALGSPPDLDLVLLTVGTGIGGAAILGGRLHRGASETAGEFGNMSIHWQGETCWCGSRGCLNMLASGSAMARRAAELGCVPAVAAVGGAMGTRSATEARTADRGATLTLHDVAAAAAAGDWAAHAAIDEGARALGAGLANIVNTWNPSRISLCGGVLALGDGWLSSVREEAGRRALAVPFARVSIGPAVHGASTGAFGAACLAQRAFAPVPAESSRHAAGPAGGGMHVPSKDYRAQYAALMPELLPLLERTLLDDEPVLGRAVTEFEAAFAAYCGVAHAIGVGSGFDALVLALRVLGVGPGDEVITAANTFTGTVTAILDAGARPVLVDPDVRTLNLSLDGVRAALTPRTKLVLPVHLYGRLAPMAGLLALCADAGVPILEDAAQAHGARAGGRRAGAFGRLGAFSFHPSKNLGAFGDGGAITTDDAALATTLRELRHLGKRDKHHFAHVAPNTKLDTLQAALLLLKLPRLDAQNARRRALAARYRAGLSDCEGLLLPEDPGDESHVWHQYVVRSARRDALRAELKAAGIQAGLHYPVAPHEQPLGVPLVVPARGLPVAEASARSVLSLPIAPELSDAQIGMVIEAVRAAHHARPS